MKVEKIICRSVIRSATELGTANFCVDLIKPLPVNALHNTEPNAMLDELITLTDFETPLSHLDEKDPVVLIPASTKSKTWRNMERSKQIEHQEDIQQRHFYSSYPKSTKNKQHQCPTRSKTAVNEVEIIAEDKEIVLLRDKWEKVTPILKDFEFILCNELGKPRLDPEEKEILVISR